MAGINFAVALVAIIVFSRIVRLRAQPRQADVEPSLAAGGP